MPDKWKVVAVTSDCRWKKEPFTDSRCYSVSALRKAYSELYSRAFRCNLRLVRTNFAWYDRKRGIFSKGWIYDSALGWKQVYDIKADFIFDKTPLNDKYIAYKKYFSKRKRILNPFFIEDLCSDKMKTYNLFRSLMPFTVRVGDRAELLRGLERIKTDKIVLKPEFGSSAKGVIIMGRAEALQKPPRVRRDTLLQEFVGCKKYDVGFKYGVADFRVILCNGRFVDAFYRFSGKGVMTSNVSTGGRIVFCDRKDVPAKVLKLAKTIDSKLKGYKPRLYTIDFLIDENDKPWLIEMNSKPGFFFYSSLGEKKRQDRFERALIDAVLSNVFKD